jgi:hypothetical protein
LRGRAVAALVGHLKRADFLRFGNPAAPAPFLVL